MILEIARSVHIRAWPKLIVVARLSCATCKERLDRHLRPHGHDIEEIWLAHPAPAHAARYDDVFGAMVRFDQPRTAIVIERSSLDRRQFYANGAYQDLLHECVARMLAEQRIPCSRDQVHAPAQVGAQPPPSSTSLH